MWWCRWRNVSWWKQAGGAGDHAVGSCSSPKYNEFFVFNNLVIFAKRNEESRNNCIDVIEILKLKKNNLKKGEIINSIHTWIYHVDTNIRPLFN